MQAVGIRTYKINGVTVEPEEIRDYLAKGPLRVDNSKGELIGILFNSYKSAQKTFFTDFLNKEMTSYVNKKAYEASNRKSQGFDVGHTYIKAESKLAELADTPLSLQVGAIIELINTVASKGAGKEFEAAAKQAYGSLYDEKFVKKAGFKLGGLQSQSVQQISSELTSYFQGFVSKHSYGQKVSVYLSKDIKGLLFDVEANIVLIQDREENQGEFARVEAALKLEVEKILSKLHFSKSAEEEMADRIEELIVFGKVKSPNVSVSKKVEADNRTKKVTNPSGRVTKGSIAMRVRPSPIRNTKGQFTSLTSVETLIRLSLYETIKKNMVSPALNFQTGRFAGSVELQSLSADRTGALTAFLTYMKYPYGTFEPGGRQGSIDRSPRLLIDRSVREIATKLVTARMKTVII